MIPPQHTALLKLSKLILAQNNATLGHLYQ